MTTAKLLARADAILAAPPRYGHIVRVPGRGELLARAVVPLKLIPTGNHVHVKARWQHAKRKAELFQILAAQLKTKAVPLTGRPHVRCVRFSSNEPDAYNDSFKAAVDILCRAGGRTQSRRRLGWLVDDAPRYALVTQWWEYAPAGAGFGLIEIWDGEEKR